MFYITNDLWPPSDDDDAVVVVSLLFIIIIIIMNFFGATPRTGATALRQKQEGYIYRIIPI